MQIRVLLFLVTLTTGIIDALADLERDLPVALGYEAEDSSRQPVILPSALTASRALGCLGFRL